MKNRCPVEDRMLFAYDFLEGAEKNRFRTHMDACDDCRTNVRGLFDERALVEFELALAMEEEDSGETVAAPVPRKARRLLPFAVASVAAVILLAVGLSLFSPRTDPPPPEPPSDRLAWTRLPDGSRFRVLDKAAVEVGRKLRRLEMGSGSLLVEVQPGLEEFEVATPYGSVMSEAGKIAISVGEGGTLVQVIEGEARLEPDGGDPREIRPGGEDGLPLVYVIEVDPNPDLLLRIADLERQVAELTEKRPDENVVARTPEEAIERFDWAGLATSLSELTAALSKGRLPDDPDVLRKFAQSVEALRELSESAEVPGEIAAVARDPRTGPLLFRARLEEAWPDASDADLDAAQETARVAMEEHQDRTGAAQTPAETAAAEEELAGVLDSEVERFTSSFGPAAVPIDDVLPPTKVQKAGSADTGQGSTEKWSKPADRVIEARPAAAARRAAERWLEDLELPRSDGPDLLRIAERWVEDYAEVLRRVPEEVVCGFEASLRGEAVDLLDSNLHLLRSELLKTQATAEERLMRLLTDEERGRLDRKSVPTFFLLR